MFILQANIRDRLVVIERLASVVPLISSSGILKSNPDINSTSAPLENPLDITTVAPSIIKSWKGSKRNFEKEMLMNFYMKKTNNSTFFFLINT